MNAWLSHLGAIALVLYAPAGLVLFFFRKLAGRQLTLWELRPWLYIWPALLLPVPFQFLAGRFPDWLITQCLLACVAALLLSTRSHVRFGLGLALLMAVFIAFFSWQRSRDLWINPTEALNAATTLRGISILNNAGHQHISIGKTWHTSPGKQTLTLSFEAKDLIDRTGWEWYRYNPNFALSPFIDETGEQATHVVPPQPAEKSRYVTREFYTGKPLAGRTFRATVMLRSRSPFVTSECDGVILQENGGTYLRQCLPVTLQQEWQKFQAEWQVEHTITTQNIRIALMNLDVPYDVKGVKLEENFNGAWLELGPLEPEGIVVRPFIDGQRRQELPASAFLATRDWRNYTFSFDVTVPDTYAHFVLQLESGTKLELRNITLTTTATNTVLQPLAFTRLPLWFPHANIAGHTVAILGLTLLNSFRSGWWGLVVTGLTFVAIYFTGSRTAWLAILFSLPWLLWLICKPRERLLGLGIVLGLGSVLILSLWHTEWRSFRVFNLTDENSVTRTDIWQVAWQGMLEHPWAGIGEGSKNFVAFWENHPGAPAQIAAHAHNFWLQFAVSFGVPGLVASLWLTAALLLLAWRRAHWRGLVVVSGVFFMNIFDYTLFYPGVLFLLILGLNMLRPEDTISSLGKTT